MSDINGVNTHNGRRFPGTPLEEVRPTTQSPPAFNPRNRAVNENDQFIPQGPPTIRPQTVGYQLTAPFIATAGQHTGQPDFPFPQPTLLHPVDIFQQLLQAANIAAANVSAALGFTPIANPQILIISAETERHCMQSTKQILESLTTVCNLRTGIPRGGCD